MEIPSAPISTALSVSDEASFARISILPPDIWIPSCFTDNEAPFSAPAVISMDVPAPILIFPPVILIPSVSKFTDVFLTFCTGVSPLMTFSTDKLILFSVVSILPDNVSSAPFARLTSCVMLSAAMRRELDKRFVSFVNRSADATISFCVWMSDVSCVINVSPICSTFCIVLLSCFSFFTTSTPTFSISSLLAAEESVLS